MVGVYIICFVIFPVAVFMNTDKVCQESEFLDRQASNVLKGIATCFVMLAHLTNYLNVNGKTVLCIFNPLGGMGVLLFFFVSGYGLYKGYGTRMLNIAFWKKRLINMYLPCVLIQLLFQIVECIMNRGFHILNIIFYSLLGAWFIDVILIQYLIFYITGKLTRGGGLDCSEHCVQYNCCIVVV